MERVVPVVPPASTDRRAESELPAPDVLRLDLHATQVRGRALGTARAWRPEALRTLSSPPAPHRAASTAAATRGRALAGGRGTEKVAPAVRAHRSPASTQSAYQG